jgi:hypothetical protein
LGLKASFYLDGKLLLTRTLDATGALNETLSLPKGGNLSVVTLKTPLVQSSKASTLVTSKGLVTLGRTKSGVLVTFKPYHPAKVTLRLYKGSKLTWKSTVTLPATGKLVLKVPGHGKLNASASYPGVQPTSTVLAV